MKSALFGPGLKPGVLWKLRLTRVLKNPLPGLKSGASTPRRPQTIYEIGPRNLRAVPHCDRSATHSDLSPLIDTDQL